MSTDQRDIPWAEFLFHDKKDDAALRSLAESFADTAVTPWISGLLPVSNEELTLFFTGTDNESKMATYPYSASALETLQTACAKASFGRGQTETLDESYRKAGKLDLGRFAWSKHLGGLDTIIKDGLVPFENGKKDVHFELYKLNVYGQGSFFKSHKDTPRRDDMFGSLVFILPADHTGGELILKHKSQEYNFDAASLLQNCSNQIAYIAFYSDVDHEVKEVTSGHRVTITYNLYAVDRNSDDDKIRNVEGFRVTPGIAAAEGNFFQVLSSLLETSTFLPDGGLLGFALQHLYPVPTDIESTTTINPLLKGIDASLAQCCRALGLKHELRVVYMTTYQEAIFISSSMMNFDGTFEDQDMSLFNQCRDGRATLVWAESEDDADDTVPVYWITDPSSVARHHQAVPTYGNSPSIEHIYSHFAIVVGVGKPGDRQSYKEIPGGNDGADSNDEDEDE